MIGRDEDAQNILQDVWLRAIRGIPRLRDGSRLRGWSFGITRRVLMDRLRRRYAMPTPSALDGEDRPSDPEPIDSESGGIRTNPDPIPSRIILHPLA